MVPRLHDPYDTRVCVDKKLHSSWVVNLMESKVDRSVVDARRKERGQKRLEKRKRRQKKEEVCTTCRLYVSSSERPHFMTCTVLSGRALCSVI